MNHSYTHIFSIEYLSYTLKRCCVAELLRGEGSVGRLKRTYAFFCQEVA